MNKGLLITGSALAVTSAAVAGAIYYQRRKPTALAPADSPTSPGATPGQAVPAPKPSSTTPITWDGALPLPTATEVKGDLLANWGTTPTDLRPLFLRAEEASRIAGAARILAIIGYRESRWTPSAHNGDETDEQSERNASHSAYHNNKARNPALLHGDAAASFGSGGLFGALAPYFLWTGVQELKDKAPLLDSDPRIMFLPRVAAFAATVYLQRLLANYEILNHADIKVGWGSVSLLRPPGRGGDTYTRIAQRFEEDAKTVGIDLADKATIPAQLSAASWPGVAAVFAELVGKLPVPRALA